VSLAKHEGLARPRRVGALTSVVLALVLAAPQSVIAQAPQSPDTAKKELENRRNELESVQERTKTLESDVDSIAKERERLNAKLVSTADLIKRSEAELTAIETRLEDLKSQERGLRATLSLRHGEISKLLSALQRMGRNPPPALITQREDALKMVRSAMMLAAAFPDLKNQALALSGRLTELVRVMNEIETQRTELKTEMVRLTDARTRLSGLMEEKKVSLEQRQSELKRMRRAAADISESVTDLNELIAKLDTAVKKNTGLGAYDKETNRQTAAADKSSPSATDAEVAINPADKAEGSVKVAALPIPPKPPGVVELAPGAGLMPGSPGRIKPAIPFAMAKARLPLPAQGSRVLAFGEKTQFGGESKGIVLETRQGAQVTSPCDGWIVYAGEFRSYGQLLIINAGGGYHVLLAGLSQIDVQPGQFVLAAEPVGTMSGWPQRLETTSEKSAPVLYVEFRKDGRPIDPGPWWATRLQKVQG